MEDQQKLYHMIQENQENGIHPV
ncbi:uncharacterized protein METZ01_LOCUS333764 [marine metagenome]|uniref:Uncharacterized protein n=1 Tax=marine metagenome TaxID=408172 RepID=A0A382Q7F8_9ZZZZ